MNPQSPFNQGGQAPYQPQPPMQPNSQQPLNPQQPLSNQQFPQQTMQPAPQPGYAPIQPASVPPIAPRPRKTSKVWIILTIVFILLTLGGAGAAVWAFMNYNEQKATVDSQVTAAVATAVKKEQDDAAAHLLEVENTPNRLFTGPSDYGNLSFNYSKLWSTYVAKDALKGGNYEAYFNPVSVPPVAPAERYALRVTIVEQDYDQVLNTYQNLVTSGQLQSSAYKVDETTSGTRLDGNFTKDIRGSAIIFKIRDKTVTLRTDAETFREYFDALIKTIKFDK